MIFEDILSTCIHDPLSNITYILNITVLLVTQISVFSKRALLRHLCVSITTGAKILLSGVVHDSLFVFYLLACMSCLREKMDTNGQHEAHCLLSVLYWVHACT